MRIINCFILTVLLLNVGCVKEKSKITNSKEGFPTEVSKIGGKVEKGPFTQGSTVVIQELTKDLAFTGNSFQTDIKDDKGNFIIESSIRFVSSYVQLACDGYFFNELNGELSNSQIRLEAIADISNKSSINVNILTHLSKERIIYLMKNESLSYKKASEQAREELLGCFGLKAYKDNAFEELSIGSGGNEAGSLIIVSSILLENRTEAQLTEYLSKLKQEFSSTGTFLETELKALRDVSLQLSISDIEANIINRYKELGQNILVPDLKYFIDWDNDGIAGNSLGDPDVKPQLVFEVDTVYVDKSGGDYRVKILSNIPIKLETVNNDVVKDISGGDVFEEVDVVNKYIEEKELVLNINPAKGALLKPLDIVVYSMDESLSDTLKVEQIGDYTKELNSELLQKAIEDAGSAFDVTYTMEALYSNCFSSNLSEWKPFTEHQVQSTDSKVKTAWSKLYVLNRDLNIILGNVGSEAKSHISPLRSLMYFQLILLWGDVPYFTNYQDFNVDVSRVPKLEIYKSLEQQLYKSISDLPEVGESKYFGVSKYVSKTMLAKILLQQNKYTEALALLESIMSSGKYSLNGNLSDVIGANSTEMIYALDRELVSTPNYEEIVQSGKYLPLLQYSEVVLMAAECNYNLGDTSKALLYLNNVRMRNGDEKTTSNAFENDLKETWKKTMRGAFSYFAFLKRNNIAMDNLGIQEYQKVFPIPQGEVLLNSMISQNPGY